MEIKQILRARWGTHDSARAAIKQMQDNWENLDAEDKARLISEIEWVNGCTRHVIKSDPHYQHPDMTTDSEGTTLYSLWVDAVKWMRNHADKAVYRALRDRPWDPA